MDLATHLAFCDARRSRAEGGDTQPSGRLGGERQPWKTSSGAAC